MLLDHSQLFVMQDHEVIKSRQVSDLLDPGLASELCLVVRVIDLVFNLQQRCKDIKSATSRVPTINHLLYGC